MERKYTKENPLPRAEYERRQSNARRRIARRKKAQTEIETAEQFERVLFDSINSESKRLSRSQISNLEVVIKDRVKNFILAENDNAIEEAGNLKRLFSEYGLTKEDVIEAVSKTRWAKLHDEILEIEITRGVEAVEAGYYITLETEEDFEDFFADIKHRGLRRLKAKRNRERQINI